MGSLGENIRNARKRMKISQQELAQKVEVSSGFLSQIENGKNMPSLITLKKLAGILGVSAGYLLGEEEEKTRLLVRCGERYRLDNLSGGTCSIEYLTDVDTQTSLELCIHTLKPLAHSGSPTNTHEGQEVWLALEGSMEIAVDGKNCLMAAGDCYYVKDCTALHMFTNLSSTQEARMLCVTTPPFFYNAQGERRG